MLREDAKRQADKEVVLVYITCYNTRKEIAYG